ncbi:hypothetical protein K0M31_014036 [Melipona bicolor]|uniref:Uncharacterized protein n=1 Tax=Melipona bicolor TaxID=60889 RepID=A0AA40G8Y1_9HYME|nr:hypothetical protein K0M31_014036 [Melipona bicolor]
MAEWEKRRGTEEEIPRSVARDLCRERRAHPVASHRGGGCDLGEPVDSEGNILSGSHGVGPEAEEDPRIPEAVAKNARLAGLGNFLDFIAVA